MRTRAIILVVAILLVAGFAALNWTEIVQTGPLSFGLFVAEAPLGLILLGCLGIALIAFLASTAVMRTASLVESHQHHKTLEAQRALADKAEASRFTDLRQHLDTQLHALRERDAIAATEFEKAMVASQRELRGQLETMNRALAARLSEMEHRLETRFERVPGYGHAGTAAFATAEPVRAAAPLRAEPVRTEPLPEIRQDDKREVAAAEPRVEPGWRKWF